MSPSCWGPTNFLPSSLARMDGDGRADNNIRIAVIIFNKILPNVQGAVPFPMC